MARRKNPQRDPEYDKNKARKEGRNQAMQSCLEWTLYLLKDKHNFSDDELMRYSAEFCKLVEEINGGWITPEAIREAIKDEYNLTVRLK